MQLPDIEFVGTVAYNTVVGNKVKGIAAARFDG